MRAAAWRAQDVKHHPASVDLELIKRLLATTKCKTLQQFLAREFSSISKEYAGGWAPLSAPLAFSSSSPYRTALPPSCKDQTYWGAMPAATSEFSVPRKGSSRVRACARQGG